MRTDTARPAITGRRALRWPALYGAVLAVALSLVGAPAVGQPGPAPAQAGTAVPAARTVALVSATQTADAAGRVVVSIATNAKKVQVKYRTASNRKRTMTRKVRSGGVQVTIPAGSHSILVRARSTSRLKASRWYAPGAPTPNWVFFADSDGNGTQDAFVDLDNDANPDALLNDINGDGRYEVFIVLGLAGSRPGIAMYDAAGDGYYESWLLDYDLNGKYEIILHDTDSNSSFDQMMVDQVGGDGVADTWVAPARQTAKAANDLMVENIVRLNQQRFLADALFPSNPFLGQVKLCYPYSAALCY